MKGIAATAIFLAVNCCCYAGVLSPTHPIIGTWRVHVPGTSCSETYVFKADGTTWVKSAEETSESTFQISAMPDSDGYYTLTDTIVRNNSLPDCKGEKTSIGDAVTVFLFFSNVADRFFFCPEHKTSGCVGPFVRSLAP